MLIVFDIKAMVIKSRVLHINRILFLFFFSSLFFSLCSPTGMIVFVGVKFVNKFAAVALTCVICSIVAVYVGIFDNFYGNDKLQ